jgi:tetratricopeptide (TPR) repeat protein
MHSEGPSGSATRDVNLDAPPRLDRFKKVFCDNAILSDPELRTVYDRMLKFEHQQHQQPSVADNVVPYAVVIVVLAMVMAGVYTLYTNLPEISAYLPKTSIAEVTTDPAREPSTVVVQPSPPVETDISDRARDKPEAANIPSVAPSNAATPEATHAPVKIAAPLSPAAADANARASPLDKYDSTKALAPSAVTSSTTGTTAEKNPSSGSSASGLIKDAKFYRDQGIELYRNGDLPVAIANFDRAIRLDPNSEEAYIDRGIALYRLHKFHHAFADVAEAIRIQNSHRVAATPLP